MRIVGVVGEEQNLIQRGVIPELFIVGNELYDVNKHSQTINAQPLPTHSITGTNHPNLQTINRQTTGIK